MKFKKILFGEEVPDKDDPKYKERYEKDVAAGKTFAQTLKLDKGAACVQRFASRHTKLFLALVFSFVLFSVGLSLYRMTQAVKYALQCCRAAGAAAAFQASPCATATRE